MPPWASCGPRAGPPRSEEKDPPGRGTSIGLLGFAACRRPGPRLDDPCLARWLMSSRVARHMPISEYDSWVARASTTSDVFNAIAEADRRAILDALMTGEKAVGAIVNDLSMSQPQVSKHLRVLSE